ncbi:phosphotransferase family protein [Gordonia sp. TBRC 11910]|uniref:Phosphotransferase family protein n=1 Tax=Gordonia asplenii TaxID=2725283 RepID=A0A848L1P9_9ACTN|nr:phosphotransferase family protein [Gordonia asplenii]NMO04940.1 phosphotransferase family protein [Gordonia asplenii]
MTGAAGDLSIPDVDSAGLLNWLGGQGVHFTGPVTATRVGQGQSNLTYRLAGESGPSLVLRRPPQGHLLASAHDVVREARIMSALGPSAVPVPTIIGVCDDADVAPVPLVLMENVDGKVLNDVAAVEELPEAQRHDVGVNMVTALVAIHDVNLDDAGLSDLASHKPYAQRQLKRWSAQWEASKTRELPALDDLTARLGANIPEHQSISLVHGDFHIRNVIIGDDAEIRAVLDWELSTLGDPLADMGSVLAYWVEPGETAIGTAEVMPAGLPTRAELSKRYLDATGRSPESLLYWHCLGLWKIAIIAEGIVRRVTDVAANAAAAGVPTSSLVDGLVERARDVAAEAGW